MHLPNNTLLQGGKYRIIRFINAGGFGCTYEAEHVMLGKRVAIKEFFVKDFCNRDEATSHVTVGTKSKVALVSKLKKKFIEEASALSHFNHPNIVHVSDVFEENGTAYFVMDFIDGKSIHEILKKRITIPESKALKYIRQVAAALEEVHSRNRLHLDIKPGNIMIDPNDNAILIDFGASKQYDEADGENTSTLLGKTPGYAPLEQMGNNVKKFSPATDIYSLGATLYKMLTGVTPPEATDLASGEALPQIPTTVSANVRDAVYAAMKLQKNQRPQTIADFVALIDNSNDDSEVTEVVAQIAHDDTPTHKPEPAQKPAPVHRPELARQSAPAPEYRPEYASRPKPVAQSASAFQPEYEESGKSQPSFSDRLKKFKLVVWVIVATFAITIMLVELNQPTTPSVQDFDTMADTLDTYASEWMLREFGDTLEYVEDSTFTNSNNIKFKFTGSVNLNNELPCGKGTGKYEFGVYTGDYVNGIRQGEGQFTHNVGQIYKGTFENDHFGMGILVFNDETASYFEGMFKDDEPYDGDYYENGKKVGTYTKGRISWLP